MVKRKMLSPGGAAAGALGGAYIGSKFAKGGLGKIITGSIGAGAGALTGDHFGKKQLRKISTDARYYIQRPTARQLPPLRREPPKESTDADTKASIGGAVVGSGVGAYLGLKGGARSGVKKALTNIHGDLAVKKGIKNAGNLRSYAKKSLPTKGAKANKAGMTVLRNMAGKSGLGLAIGGVVGGLGAYHLSKTMKRKKMEKMEKRSADPSNAEFLRKFKPMDKVNLTNKVTRAARVAPKRVSGFTRSLQLADKLKLKRLLRK